MGMKYIQDRNSGNILPVVRSNSDFAADAVPAAAAVQAEMPAQSRAATVCAPINGGRYIRTAETSHKATDVKLSAGLLSDALSTLSASDILFLSGSSSENTPCAHSGMIMDNLFGKGKWSLADWRRMALAASLALVVNGGMYTDVHAQFTSNVTGFTVSGETVSGTDARQYIRNGGRAINGFVLDDGEQFVDSGGSTTNMTINSDGEQYVYSGGHATGTIVNSDGEQRLYNGATVTGTVINAGGSQFISGGWAHGTVINTGGTQSIGDTILGQTGGAQNTRISGGVQDITSGGIASGTIIYTGSQVVSAGGGAHFTTVSGGTQVVSGYAGETTVHAGGHQHVSGGGEVTGTTLSGGTQHVGADGIVRYTEVYAGGAQVLAAGATVSSSNIYSGGALIVSAGGSANLDGRNFIYAGGTLSAGTINLTRGAADMTFVGDHASPVGTVFTGSGSLRKEGAGMLTLTGTNTYSGGTVVDGGTLSIGSDSNIGTGDNRLINFATLRLTGSTTYTKGWGLNEEGANIEVLSGTATMSGIFKHQWDYLTDTPLTKIGAGTLVLTGANDYRGLTTVREGTLTVGREGNWNISDRLALYGGATLNSTGVTLSPGDLNLITVYSTGSTETIRARWTGNLVMAGQTTMRFMLGDDVIHDSTVMLGGTVNLGEDQTRIEVGFIGRGPTVLNPGEDFILINSVTGTPQNDTYTYRTRVNFGEIQNFTFDIHTGPSENQLFAGLAGNGIEVECQRSTFANGYLSGLAFLNQGGDLVASLGMMEAVRASKKPNIAFGAISGGKLRYNTGSHSDISGVSMLAGAAFGADLTQNRRMTLGGFVEYGTGSYDTYNSYTVDVIRGDGNMNHFGAGVLGRMDFLNDAGANDYYAEGSFRLGRLSNRFHSGDLGVDTGEDARYKSSSTYFSTYVGAGRLLNINQKNTLELYGRYFWTHLGSDSVSLSASDSIQFNSLNSHRMRAGGRLSHELEQNVFVYAGAAWEYEFDGKAKSSRRGSSIDAPSIRGSTGIGELGITWQPSKNRPLFLDLGFQGYVGKREGVTGSLRVKYEF